MGGEKGDDSEMTGEKLESTPVKRILKQKKKRRRRCKREDRLGKG